MRISLTALAAVALASATAAQATNIGINGDGWCNMGGCNNTDPTHTNNTLAGLGDNYRNWFSVAVPLGDINSASLTIWDEGNNYYNNTPDAVYSLHAATGISYDGLGEGDVLGTITLGEANAQNWGHYVTIVLNDAGIAALRNARGGSFLFGGVTPGSAFAGYGDGRGAYLSVSSDPVPEPASWAMMLGGFVMIGGALRARRKVAIRLA